MLFMSGREGGKPETCKGVYFESRVRVATENLGMHGVLDMVECNIRADRKKTRRKI